MKKKIAGSVLDARKKVEKEKAKANDAFAARVLAVQEEYRHFRKTNWKNLDKETKKQLIEVVWEVDARRK